LDAIGSCSYLNNQLLGDLPKQAQEEVKYGSWPTRKYTIFFALMVRAINPRKIVGAIFDN
jgi:hypothetical protein